MEKEINRICIVDKTGQIYDETGVSVKLYRQDDGLTLKVFIEPLPEPERRRAILNHMSRFGQGLGLE